MSISVLTGHSHSYERSVLIDGHYGTSGTWNPSTMLKQGGSGDPDGSGGAYTKDAVPHDGAVYAVAGSAGQISGGSLNHPVMIVDLKVLGSMILDVNANELDGRYIDSLGSVRDRLRIVHNPPPSVPAAPTDLAVTGTTRAAYHSRGPMPRTTRTGSFSNARSTRQSGSRPRARSRRHVACRQRARR